MDAGLTTDQLDPATVVDSILANRNGSTVQIDLIRFLALLAAMLGPSYATRAELYADLNWPAGAPGYVRGDATTAYNGVYKKAGAFGEGSWGRIGDLPSGAVEAAQLAELEDAVALRALSASPELTGTPTAPTAAPGTNTTQIATTAFIKAALDALVAAAPGTLDTLNELATALGGDANFAATITGLIGTKAPSASPALTGTPTAPTAAPGTNTTQIATTAFIRAALDALVAAAPGALDTLNELAAALGGDANFAATITALIGTKAAAAALTAETEARVAADVGRRIASATAQATRMPREGGDMPLVADAAMRADLWQSADGIDGRFARPGSARLPMAGGVLPLALRTDGEILSASVDGIAHAAGEIYAPEAYLATALGRQQVFVREVDRLTLAETTRQISFAQMGDLSAPLVVGPDRARVRQAVDDVYTRGAVGWRSPMAATGTLQIIVTTGQSNSVGATAAINGGVTIPQTLITTQVPLPAGLVMFNGGDMPHQDGHRPTSRTTAISAGQITSLTDAYTGANAGFLREGMGIGAGEVLAGPWGYCGATRVLVCAAGHGSSDFTQIIGSAGVDAVPWQNLQAMVARAAILAAGLGLTPQLAGVILNGHEANEADSIATWKARLGVLRDKVDALAATLAQVNRVPLILCQVGAPVPSTGIVSNVSLGSEEYARENRGHTLLLPQYWTEQGDYATVHYAAPSHRMLGEAAGHLLADHMYGGAIHLHMVSASRSGTRVTVEMSEPVIIDRHAVADPGQAGIVYRDARGAVAVTRVTAEGAQLLLDLAAVPSGTGEQVSIACDNAKLYVADAYYGLGRRFGQRSCVRGKHIRHWSQTTGRPFYSWAAHQRASVTI